MPTIKDVAKASQVCPATVSNVLNNRRQVHPRTREKVLAAARRMNYHPSAVGRGLVHKRMNTLGVVFLHSDVNFRLNQYLVAILEGILAVATQRKQNTTLYTSYSWAAGGELLPTLCDGRTDGTLQIVPPQNDQLDPGLLQAGVPFVMVGSQSTHPQVSTVDVNNRAAACQLVEHLIFQGHRHIALLHFRSGLSFRFVEERIAGYRLAHEKHGLFWDESLVLAYTSLDEAPEDGYASLLHQIQALMSRPASQRPTALFCIHDRAAQATLEALKTLGLRVPCDLSVVGFDDVASATDPPLTTVHQPFHEIGERAANLLLAQIDFLQENNAMPPPHKDFLPTTLIARASVAKKK